MNKTLNILDHFNLKTIMNGGQPTQSHDNKASVLRLECMGLVIEMNGVYFPVIGESYTYAGFTHVITSKK